MNDNNAAAAGPEERWRLIARDIPRGEGEADFVVGEEEIRAILAAGRDPNLYWGTATTGAPHVGYFVPIFKIGDFLKAGCHVTILFADLHGFLDNMKSSWELLHHKCVWYENIIRQMLLRVDVPLERLKFVRGTSYQLKEQYTLDVYKMAALVTTAHAQHAGAEVVKQSAAPKLSNLLYPLLQALDEEYLGCDIQFGGVDQRKIFMFAREWLPRIGYKKRSYVMNPLIPGLGKSGKMSSSEKLSKVDLHDAPEVIRDKFLKAYSVDGQPAGNGMLALLRHVLFRYLESVKQPFVCAGRSFATYAELEDAFRDGSLVSLPLKEATAELLSEFLAPLRDFYAANRGLYDAAYPAASESHAETAAAAAAVGGGLVGVRLESGRVVSIEPHPSSAKHRVVKLSASGDRTLVAVPTEDAPQLAVGEHLVFVANGVEQNVKEVIANAHLLTSASFDKAKGLRSVCYLVAPPGSVGPVVFGAADTPSDTPLSLSAVGKSLKSLEVKDGMLAFKGFFAEPRVTVAVDNQIKI